MAQRKILLTASAALLGLLAGCVSFGAKAPPSLLVLTAQSSVAKDSAISGAQRDALVILIPEVPQKLQSNRVPVQIDNSNIAYLQDAVWADKPARLMQSLLMETIAAKNGGLVLNEINAGGKAQNILSGSLLEFGLDAPRNQAVIVFDAVRLRSGQPVEKRRFEAREAVVEMKPAAASAALNQAANKIARDVAAWLASTT
jgi:cholesterol transport system auxiliary component